MNWMITRAIKTIGLVFLGFAFLLSVEGSCPLQAAEPIKIGAVVAITGWAGALGTMNKESIIIATERVNRQGGLFGRPIEVYIEDDQSSPTNSAIAVTKLIRDKKVCAVLGSTLTIMCMSMLPIFEREQVPNASFGAGYEITFPIKKWVFRFSQTDFLLSPVMLKFAVRELGARKIALLHCTDASGMMGAKGIIESAPKYGVSSIITEKFDPQDTNMIPQLTKINAARPDVILLYGTAPNAAVIAKNYHQLGMEIPVVGSHGIPTPDFIKLAGKFVEGGRWIIFGNKCNLGDKLPSDDPWRKNIFDPFMKDLKERFGRSKIHVFHGPGYDGAQGVIEALKIAKTDDRAALQDAMEKLSFDGIMSPYKFSPTDHDGIDIDKSIFPSIIEGDDFWPYRGKK